MCLDEIGALGIRAAVVGLIGAISAAALFAGGCGSEGESPGASSRAGLPDQEVLEFSLTESVQGSKSWTLFADKAEVFGKGGYSNVEGVRIDFYGPEGEVTSVLTSSMGRVDNSRKDLRAFGNVVLRTTDGVVLETETLNWDNSRELMWSDDFVTVRRGRETLTGYGLESDPGLEHVEVKEQVKITVEGETPSVPRDDSSKGSGAARRM